MTITPRERFRRYTDTALAGTMKFTLLALLVLSLGSPRFSHAAGGADTGERGIGIRTAGGSGVNTVELYVRWPAPFVQTHILQRYLPAAAARWESSLSYWKGGNDHATVFAVGPTIEYPLPRDHWRLSLGIQPTLFSDYESDNRNLGGPFEFTSHIGLRWQSHPEWYVGARVQHTSNAGLYESNPGIDLFALEFGSRF